MNQPIYAADGVHAAPVYSVAPVLLPTPDRAVNLQLRVSAPTIGERLPVILLSHGLGHSNHLSSLNGYGPLANFWAAHGFVVIQPTHLDSATLKLESNAAAPHWRTRAEDMSVILDHLEQIETAVPQLRGRIDGDKIAVAGHSMGGNTASLLLGARPIDPYDGAEVNLTERRITAGVLLAAPGRGGDALTEFTREHYPFLSTIDFTSMVTPALVVVGDEDSSDFLTVNGPQWHADPYSLAPTPKSLLTLFGGEHCLGGISGYDAAETTDENPARVEAVQWLTWAYLRRELAGDDAAWSAARRALAAGRLGRVDSK